MSLELVVGLVAVFVSGGAVGTAGTLLAQWILRKVDGSPRPSRGLDDPEMSVLRSELAEMGRHMRNMDARLDFTERLLDGALSIAPPPERHRTPDLENDRPDDRETGPPEPRT